jgi:hypothetical protein
MRGKFGWCTKHSVYADHAEAAANPYLLALLSRIEKIEANLRWKGPLG